MKIAYVDIVLDGHHMSYLKALVKENENSILIIPSEIEELQNKQYIIDSDSLYKHPLKYIKWICNIRKIVKSESIDVVHFLYGDVFYRYFGFGLKGLKHKKLIGTFHQIRRSRVKDLSLKNIFKNLDMGIVHTDSLKKDMNNIGIENIYKIEYPQFNNISNPNNVLDVKRKLNIPENVPIIAAIGGTREDKGLDLLLDALNEVKEEFHLLIAGKEVNFSKSFIYEHIEKYRNKVTLKMKYLTNQELADCLISSDIIVLPYRKSFDGASGPLGEGVWLRKCIIGPNHGSLGKIINDNCIGITFETESTSDLAIAIKKALNGSCIWSEEAEEYRKKIDVKKFIKDYTYVYINISK